MDRFVCVSGIDQQLIPEDLLRELGITSPEQLHDQAESIIEVSRGMKRNDWVRLPFCNTLLSEILGAAPILSLSGARIKEPPYQKIDALPVQPDLSSPRLCTMLDAVESLSSDGNLVAYNVEGPFTILCSLLPMSRIFSALRKPIGQALLQKAEDWITLYTDLAVKRGTKLISFADPVATIDILGERMFTEVYFPALKRLLMRLQAEHPNIPIHLCGKLTQSLLDTGRCTVTQLYFEGCQTYGQALSVCCELSQGGLVGHFCMNYLDAKRPYVSIINFEGKEETT